MSSVTTVSSRPRRPPREDVLNSNYDQTINDMLAAAGQFWTSAAELLLAALGGAAAEAALAPAEAGEMCTVSRWGRAGLEPEDWVMKGDANFFNYLKSGKWDPGRWN